jgi:hypothetical protein
MVALVHWISAIVAYLGQWSAVLETSSNGNQVLRHMEITLIETGMVCVPPGDYCSRVGSFVNWTALAGRAIVLPSLETV